MSLPSFQLLRPRTVEEAVALLARHPGDIKILAGGTDLIPSLKQRLFSPAYLLDISRIREMQGIRTIPGKGLEIGALTRITEIEHSPVIRSRYPVLHHAVSTIASPILRNMGTLGGNICLDTRCLWYNQSLTWRKSCGFCIKKDGDLCHVAPGGKRCWAAFSADSPPALLCLDATLEIASASGVRRLPIAEFYSNDGIAHLKLNNDELLTRVFLPESSGGWSGMYYKLRVRGSIDYPLAGVAVALNLSPHNGSASIVKSARAAITGVNPAPLLVPNAAEILQGKVINEELAAFVAEAAAKIAKPLTTSALTAEYRREIIRVFSRRATMAAGISELSSRKE